MAKKKQVKKQVKKVKLDEDLVRKVDSLVDEIERTNNFKRITDEDIEELENTLSKKKLDPIEDDSEDIFPRNPITRSWIRSLVKRVGSAKQRPE